MSDKEFQKVRQWEKIDELQAVPNFSRLSQTQLEELTLGIFQIKQAKSYTNKHIDDDGCYEVMVSTQAKGLLKEKIQSTQQ